MTQTDNIEGLGHPLGFRQARGARRPGVLHAPPSRDVFTVEARQLAGHQKEAVVTEGDRGSAWRITSDEGKHLRGTDLAPFPLGFFNAGLHSDLINRILDLAQARSIPVDDLGIDLDTFYYMTGSFFRGDGVGFAGPPAVDVWITSSADGDTVDRLVRDAVRASPAFAALRVPVVNTFALYVNGRRRPVTSLPASGADDAPDPFLTYGQAPRPLADHPPRDLIRKTGVVADGEITPAPTGTTTRIIRTVAGSSRVVDGMVETDTVLGLQGMSHFAVVTDERPSGEFAPSGLSLLSAAVAFCYMTQLSRYIEHMKFPIRGVRLVQHTPYTLEQAGDGLQGGVEPVDTHLFLSGDTDLETHERHMHIAARTCYLHSTLAASLEPVVTVHHRAPERS